MSDTLIDTSKIPAFNRGYRLQWEDSQQGHVLLYPEGMARLNGSAALIMQHIDGSKPVQHIIDTLQAQFPDAPDLPADVQDFIRQAVQNNWLSLHDEAAEL